MKLGPLPDPATFEGDGHAPPPTEMFRRALAEPVPQSEIEPGELEAAVSKVQSYLLRYVDPPYELESRWMAARSLIQRGQAGAALRLLEEAMVLGGTMADLEGQGKHSDLLDMKIDARLAQRLAHLQPQVAPDEVARSAREAASGAFAQGLASDGFKGAVLDVVERRLEQQLRERGFEDAIRGLIEARLAAWAGEEPFQAAAAAASAARPPGLLDRPETRARMETVAAHSERTLLGSARFVERVTRLLQERGADDARVQGLVEELTGKRLEVWLDSPELQARLGPREPGAPALDPARLAALLEGPELREALARGVARLLGPGGAPVVQAALDSRLVESLRGNPAATRFVEDAALRVGARLAEEARSQAVSEVEEKLRTTSGPALEARVKRLVESALLSLEERMGTLIEAQLTSKVRALVDERLSERLGKAVAEAMDAPLARALEPVRAGLEKRVEKQLEAAFPALLVRALAEGQPALERLQEAVDSALKRNVDEERVVRMVRKELLNRQALQNASLSGEGLLDQATAITRIVEEKIKELRAQERGPRRPPPPGPPAHGPDKR